MIAHAYGIEEVRDTLSGFMDPPKQESVCDWVENNVELPTGEITGKIDLAFIPYAREILEHYGNKDTRHIVMVFPTQAAKTTILTIGMLYKIARDPEDAMWVMGNADQARDFNKERFMPFAQICQPVMELIPRTSKGLVNKHLWGFTSQHYRSMVLNFVGAGSTTNLSSRPRGLICMDECDKYYDELKFDSGTIQLAEERQKTFTFPLSVKASSPTLESRMIWQEYLKTDMRKYWLPCPRCEQEITLQFKVDHQKFGPCGLRWWHENEDEAKTDGQWDMKKVRANAFYKCQCCGGKIHSFERQGMLENGIWRPGNKFAETGRHGYHLNSMYSILSGQTSLGAIAIKFLLAKGLRGELQNFFNGWMAEPFSDEMAYGDRPVNIEVFTSQDIDEDAVPIMGVDVQHGHFWVVIRKFAKPTPAKPYGESWLVFADRVETEEQLVQLQEDYDVKPPNVILDMADRPNQVGQMIIKNGWRGIWGSPNTRKWPHTIDGQRVYKTHSQTQYRDPMLGTKWENRTFQRAAYVYFSKHDALDLVFSLRYPLPGRPNIWHITANCSPRYARHLNSKIKREQTNKRNGRVEWVYVDLHKEDHLLDCECIVAVKAQTMGLISPPPESVAQNFAA